MSDSPTPKQLRATAEEALRQPGQRRIRALTELEAADAELLPFVANAVRNEVSLRRISTMTGLATNTVTAWVKRFESEQTAPAES
jgi:hypothetical protein